MRRVLRTLHPEGWLTLADRVQLLSHSISLVYPGSNFSPHDECERRSVADHQCQAWTRRFPLGMRGLGASAVSPRQISKDTLTLEVSCRKSMSGKKTSTRLEDDRCGTNSRRWNEPYRQEGDHILKAELHQDFDQDI